MEKLSHSKNMENTDYDYPGFLLHVHQKLHNFGMDDLVAWAKKNCDNNDSDSKTKLQLYRFISYYSSPKNKFPLFKKEAKNVYTLTELGKSIAQKVAEDEANYKKAESAIKYILDPKNL